MKSFLLDTAFLPTADARISSIALHHSCPYLPCLLIPSVIVLIRASVNHLHTLSPVFTLNLLEAVFSPSLVSSGLYLETAQLSWATMPAETTPWSIYIFGATFVRSYLTNQIWSYFTCVTVSDMRCEVQLLSILMSIKSSCEDSCLHVNKSSCEDKKRKNPHSTTWPAFSHFISVFHFG